MINLIHQVHAALIGRIFKYNGTKNDLYTFWRFHPGEKPEKTGLRLEDVPIGESNLRGQAVNTSAYALSPLSSIKFYCEGIVL